MEYRLEGGEQHNLQQHVNKQVEIRGTVQNDMNDMHGAHAMTGRTGQTGQTAQTAQTGQTGQTGQMAQGQADVQKLPTLKVTSVRQVAESCSADNR